MKLDNLYFLRESEDLTQSELAKILKIDRSLISHWEIGSDIIPLKHLNTICNYFNVSMDYIFGLNNKKNYLNTLTKLNKKLIGERLVEIRNKNNLRQKDIANILNTTPSTICAYEKGKTLILTIFVYELAKEFNISMDYICGRIN